MSKQKSRADRLADAIGNIEDAYTCIEELKDELEQWYANIPENLQGGSKAYELDEAIGALDYMLSNLAEVTGSEVCFPKMYG